MTNLPSLAQLKKAVILSEKLEQLEAELAALLGEKEVKVKAKGEPKEKKTKKTRRTMSPESREKIAAAQRKRWAKTKRAAKAPAAAKA